MTALAGLLGPRPAVHSRLQVAAMLEAQRGFGSGQPLITESTGIVLGRRLHALVPEDRHDLGPIEDSAGHWLMAADLRLDNCGELADALSLPVRQAGMSSDAALLLAAWQRWGEGALGRLAGEYAFALWDARGRRLILARDPLGARPLCFHRGKSGFCFASMPSGLLAVSGLDCRPDEESLQDFVNLARPAEGRTFFAGIEQVPPGHVVEVQEETVLTRRFWNPRLDCFSERDPDFYIEKVRNLLDIAVAACLRGAGNHVGAHLSAGLDSAGVAATAAKLMRGEGKVAAFTAVPSAGCHPVGADRIADESVLAAQTAAAYPNISHHLLCPEGSPLDALDQSYKLFQRPLPNPLNYMWASAIQGEAGRQGLRVLLTGQAGNLSFSHHGFDCLPQLLAGGRLARLGDELWRLHRAGMPGRALLSATIAPLAPRPFWTMAQRLRGRPTRPEQFSLARCLAVNNAVDYAEQPLRAATQARLETLRALNAGQFHKGLLAGWGLDVRDPTADTRLVEFCLRVPAEQYLMGGRSRALARRVLADRLPPQVVTERRRGQQAADWRQILDGARAQIEAEASRLASSPAASEVIDFERVQHLLREWPSRWAGGEQVSLYKHALPRALAAAHFAASAERGAP